MKLIDKDALLAEIERRLEELYKLLPDASKVENGSITISEACNTGKYTALESLKDYVDTLEVKEEDIEDSIKETLAQKYVDYTFKRHNIDPESKEGQLIYYAYMHGMNQCLTQLRTQKGE